VPTAADGEQQPVLAREVDRAHDVGGPGRAHDGGGVPVDHGIPDRARLLVAWLARKAERTVQLAA
jgi:hypothetical protein